MAYNNYGFNNYGMNTQSFPSYQPNFGTVQPQNNFGQARQGVSYNSPSDYPFLGVKFVNEQEANSFTLDPNTRILLMDKNNQVFWVKWTDSMGSSSMEKYRFERCDVQQQEQVPQIDVSNFATKDDLKGFAKAEDLAVLKEFNDKLERLEKKIKIKEIEKGV